MHYLALHTAFLVFSFCRRATSSSKEGILAACAVNSTYCASKPLAIMTHRYLVHGVLVLAISRNWRPAFGALSSSESSPGLSTAWPEAQPSPCHGGFLHAALP